MPSSMTGILLVSSPVVRSPVFSKSVVYVCSDDSNGTMGLVINNPVKNMDMKSVLEQLGVDVSTPISNSIQVLTGGPIEASRGFVLHSNDLAYSSTVTLQDDLALTATIDVLENIAKGSGPKDAIFCLGYTGWERGKLYEEFLQNKWLICSDWKEILFSNNTGDEKWRAALATSGVNSPESLLSVSSTTH